MGYGRNRKHIGRWSGVGGTFVMLVWGGVHRQKGPVMVCVCVVFVCVGEQFDPSQSM